MLATTLLISQYGVSRDMPTLSSPVSYPPSSSPPSIIPADRKRSLLAEFLPYSKRRRGEKGGPLSPKDCNLQTRSPGSEGLREKSAYSRPIASNSGPFVDDEEENEGCIVNRADSYQETEFCVQTSKDILSSGQHDTRLQLDSSKNEVEPTVRARLCSGKQFHLAQKPLRSTASDQELAAERSLTVPGKATKSFYGVEIHSLLEKASTQIQTTIQSRDVAGRVASSTPVEVPKLVAADKTKKHTLWSEKYRARKFSDLVGDERTHRDVLRWLKGWDSIVFALKQSSKPKFHSNTNQERPHRKILLLTGAPGLGKTTLAHVCAKQAGYEAVEINASDERNRDVVKGRVRDIVGTENVKGVNTKAAGAQVRRAGRPVCLIVDEVDGVAAGHGNSNEGGFMNALVDLVSLDQKTASSAGTETTTTSETKKPKKGDKFRIRRPIILICNDVYHPALKALRVSSVAEIIHVRTPPLDKVIARLKAVFEKEGVACDGDGVRKLCESAWGISNRRRDSSGSNAAADGDLRGVMVVSEWVAHKLKTENNPSAEKTIRLTKKWVEQYLERNSLCSGSSNRGHGRSGVRGVVERIFLEGGGFPKTATAPLPNECLLASSDGAPSVSRSMKCRMTERLQDLIETSGDCDRIITDCFSVYPSKPFQDDMFLSKPNAGYEWLYFHDSLSARIFHGQEWELNPYLSQSALGFHHLFASTTKYNPGAGDFGLENEHNHERSAFSGPQADYLASEKHRQNTSILQGLQSSLSVHSLRTFRSIDDIANGLLPYVVKILLPDVKPVILGGKNEVQRMVSVRKESERQMMQRAVSVMSGIGVTFERSRVEASQVGGISDYVYRMEP